MKIVDLSVALANDVPADPPFQKVSIEYTEHAEGAQQTAAAFPGSGARTTARRPGMGDRAVALMDDTTSAVGRARVALIDD